MAFSNLIGSILFLALGIWAWFQTDGFPEVANTYVQASTFPRIMIVGMVIFAAVLFVQSILKLMGTLKDTDPLAVAAYAESLMPTWGGVGRYPVKAGRVKGWVHVDTRANKSRWTL